MEIKKLALVTATVKLYLTLREVISKLIATGAFIRECIKIIEATPSSTLNQKPTARIVTGAWYFNHEIIAGKTIKNHTYFQEGESEDLAKSLCNSTGNEVHLRSHQRDHLVISYNCNGMLAYSGGKHFDKYICHGQSPRTSSSAKVLKKQSVIIVYQRNATNYFHFLTEVVISLIAHLDLIKEKADYTLVLPNIQIADEAMALLEIKNKTSKLDYQGILTCQKSIVLDLIPAGFASPIFLEKLRHLAYRYAPHKSSKTQGKVVFLNRGESSSRRLSNANRVYTIIQEYFSNAIYVETDLMPLRDQIESFKDAEIIITPQGAHSINLIWSKKLTCYIEISPNQDNSITHYAEILGAQVEIVKSTYHNPKDFNSSHDCDLHSLDKTLEKVRASTGDYL